MSQLVLVSNSLLTKGPQDALAPLRPLMERVALGRREVLSRPGRAIRHVYFPQSGIVSIVANADGRPIEVGMFGKEGMSATCLLFGIDRPVHETFAQIPGSALRIEVAPFREALDRHPSLRPFLLRYAYLLHLQISENAMSNALASLEQRLARWLLLCRDRLDGDEIAITHESLAAALGVRRPTVTLTIQTIEGSGIVRATRGKIEIRDRERLTALAGACYGGATAEYRKFFGEALTVLPQPRIAAVE